MSSKQIEEAGSELIAAQARETASLRAALAEARHVIGLMYADNKSLVAALATANAHIRSGFHAYRDMAEATSKITEASGTAELARQIIDEGAPQSAVSKLAEKLAKVQAA